MGTASFYRELLKFRLRIWITMYNSSPWDKFGLKVARKIENLLQYSFPSKEKFCPFIYQPSSI